MSSANVVNGLKNSRSKRASPWRTAMIAPARPNSERGPGNENDALSSMERGGASAASRRLSVDRQQEHDRHVAQRADRDQGREDRRRAREGHGGLPALSRGNAGIGPVAGGYPSPGGPEGRTGIWPSFRRRDGAAGLRHRC